MKEPKRRHGLNGVVLIMILTVMAVLIVLLMTTLTVVTTANQRIYTKFEENQAYYSARSALDVFTAEMLADGDYYAVDSSGNILKYYYTDTTVTPSAVKDVKMKQGLALQGELYKIKSQGQTTAKVAAALNPSMYRKPNGEPNDAAYAALGLAENFKASDLVFGGSTPEDAFFSIDDAEIDSITYKITFPALDDGSDKYGNMSDGNTATITVQVLDRVYDMGGVSREDIINNPATYTPSAIKAAIAAGDRKKDKLRIKITATTVLAGVEGNAVLILDSDSTPNAPSSRAVTSMTDVKRGTSFNMVGGASSLTSHFETTNDGNVVDDVFAIGDIIWDSSSKYHMPDSKTQMISLGTCLIGNNGGYPYVEGNGAVIYGYDAIKLMKADNDMPPSGGASRKVNLITPGSLGFGDNPPKIHGNVYANEINFYQCQNSGKPVFHDGAAYCNTLLLHKNTVEITPPSGGAGVLKFKQHLSDFVTASGSLNIATGKVYIDDNGNGIADPTEIFTITGSPGAYNAINSLGQSYTVQDVPANVTFNPSGEVKVDYYNGAHYGNALTSDFQKEFTLPANLAGFSESKVSIPTIQSLYKDYFDESEFVKESSSTGHGGEFAFIKIKKDNPSDPITLKDGVADYDGGPNKTAIQNTIATHIKTAQERNNGTPLNSLSGTAVTVESPVAGADSEMISDGIRKVIRSSGVLAAGDYGSQGPFAIDARTSNVVIQLGTGNNPNYELKGVFIIYGDKNVTITCPESTSGPSTPITYNFGTTDGQKCVFASRHLFAPSDAGAVNGGTASIELDIGSGGSTAAPNVDILAGQNAHISMGTGSFVTAYFYCPQSNFLIAGGANGTYYKFKYNPAGYLDPLRGGTGKSSFNVIGSVLCQHYGSAQAVGVCYINRSATTTNHGEPILDWVNVQYSRY